MSEKTTTGAAWPVLLVSACLEAVWATALHASDGFTNAGDTVVFLVALTLSMLGLGYAARQIPIGTAYAIWTGLGAALTVTWAMVTGEESASVLKVLFLAGIVGCAVGLKLVHAPAPDGAAAPRRSSDGPA
ncbi:DMT family transporter [Luteimicrobium sp. DT211]|uniref:DMT family transporter n=1 Tax=Luteimicrobium sp. DT211 TaxID=3393412 RepID=UPI003CE85EF8